MRRWAFPAGTRGGELSLGTDVERAFSRGDRSSEVERRALNDLEAQRRAAMFAAVRPYAYANEVRKAFERARRPGGACAETKTDVHSTQMFDAKPAGHFGAFWARPTYQTLAVAQAHAAADAARRGERHGSVDSDLTTHERGGDSPERGDRTFGAKVVPEDDSPKPEAGVTCACCRTQKTPLWRNGPTGAKTLCNACGVRFKAGRVVCDENGNVVTVAPKSRKRESLGSFDGVDYTAPKRIKPLHSSFAFTHLDDGRLYELQRVGDGGGKVPLPRVHSATILTDYDGAVLLMLLHSGDEDDEESES